MKKNKISGMQQEADTASKVFFGNNRNFAEVFNKLLFNKNLIDPEKLEDSDTTEGAVIEISEGNRITLQKYRDIKKKLYENTILCFIGMENQTYIHYLEPLVMMGYDYIDYMKQVNNIGIEYKNRGERLSGDEHLSRFKREEKLVPVISLVIYYGEKEWDGPKRLSDLFQNTNSELYGYVNDYPLHIIDVQRMTSEEINSLSGEVKAVLGFIRYSAQADELKKFITENENQFENVSIEAAKMINSISKNAELNERIEKAAESAEGGINMCKALNDWAEMEKNEGRMEGRREGGDAAIERMIALLRESGVSAEVISKAADKARHELQSTAY